MIEKLEIPYQDCAKLSRDIQTSHENSSTDYPKGQLVDSR
jgi:hypothetical protein